MAVGYAGHGAKLVADAVAGTIGHFADAGAGQPGGDLALQARLEVFWRRQVGRQRAGKKPQRVQRNGIGKGLRLGRTDALDGVVDSPNAGRKPEPLRRMEASGGVEDDRDRTDGGSSKVFLDAAFGIGATGNVGKFGR